MSTEKLRNETRADSTRPRHEEEAGGGFPLLRYVYLARSNERLEPAPDAQAEIRTKPGRTIKDGRAKGGAARGQEGRQLAAIFAAIPILFLRKNSL